MNTNGFNFQGSYTAAANTVITKTIPNRRGRLTRITDIVYENGATAHTLTILKALATTTVATIAAAGQADVILAADPGGLTPAANDFMTFEKPDRTVHTGVVSSWNAGTKTVTLTANVPTGGFAVGGKVWFHGVPGDQTESVINAVASATLSRSAGIEVGLATSNDFNEPIILHSNNATNAGTLRNLSGIYALR